ncbi:MAG: MBL fold metallo-hydrolase [Acholeplasmataceae bacterium]|nr:MBL fold metallo-hydrolase [Acholeplasmataceae bacterium]
MQQFIGNDTISHAYLICRFDQCLIIDPSHDFEAIQQALNGRTLLGILLTHAHSDHVDLIGYFDVPVHVHFDDAHLLFEDQYNGYAPHAHPYKRKNLRLNYVTHATRIPFADHYVEVFHTPGHTKGSVCYLYDQKLYTGDTLFKGSVGRHDLYSGSLPDLRKSILMLCDLPANIKVYPGHDEQSTIRYEYQNNPFFLKWSKQKNR